jgi:hypothetical protein
MVRHVFENSQIRQGIGYVENRAFVITGRFGNVADAQRFFGPGEKLENGEAFVQGRNSFELPFHLILSRTSKLFSIENNRSLYKISAPMLSRKNDLRGGTRV